MLRFLISDPSKGGQREFERPGFPDAIKADLKEFLECAARLNECSFAQDPSFLSKISFKLGKDGSIRSERRKKIHQVAEHFPLDVQKPIVAFLFFFALVQLINSPHFWIIVSSVRVTRKL
jgi:hypothetical protein